MSDIGNPELSKEDQFVVSIHCEEWTHSDKEAGEPGERRTEVDHDTVDTDRLQREVRNFGINEPSSRDPLLAPRIWFISTYPREDRDFFEQGIEKFYSLHIHEANGHEPTQADYARIANLIGVELDIPSEQAIVEETNAPDTPTPLNYLCDEYDAWNHDNGLKLGSADEHLDDENLTPAQRAWLRDFSNRWAAAEAIERTDSRPTAAPGMGG